MYRESDFVPASALGVAEPAEPTEPKIEKREAKIELRDGRSFLCKCVIEKGEEKPGQEKRPDRLIGIILVNESGRIDLREMTGLPNEFPVFESEQYRPCLVMGAEIGEEEIHVKPLLNIENLAIFLHEAGHYVQYKDEEFLRHLLDGKDKNFLEETSGAVEREDWLLLAKQWPKTKEIFLTMSLKNIRRRFHSSFLDFQRDLLRLDGLFEEYLGLDNAFWELQKELQEAYDQDPNVDTGKFEELEVKNRGRQKAIVAELPIERIKFFLYEPTRIKELDATRRAIIWLRKIGRELQLNELKQRDNQGTEALLDKFLPTYSTGCIEKNKI